MKHKKILKEEIMEPMDIWMCVFIYLFQIENRKCFSYKNNIYVHSTDPGLKIL